jgi:hypothetical protein
MFGIDSNGGTWSLPITSSRVTSSSEPLHIPKCPLIRALKVPSTNTYMSCTESCVPSGSSSQRPFRLS